MSESLTLGLTDIHFSYPRGLRGPRPGPVFESLTWASPPGRTVILGPNGAGKSTLLALGATALQPDSGTIRLGALDVSRSRDLHDIRRKVGWMPQVTRAVPGLTCREQVAYAGWLKGMSTGAAWSASAPALDRVGLSVDGARLTTALSGGQRRRLGLAQLLVHDAELFLLDEPTAGLDPVQRGRFRDMVQELSGAAPIVVSTHEVADLTDLFDVVVVLDHGRMVFQDTVSTFMQLASPDGGHQAEAAYASLIPAER